MKAKMTISQKACLYAGTSILGVIIALIIGYFFFPISIKLLEVAEIKGQTGPMFESLFRSSPEMGALISKYSSHGFLRIYDGNSTGTSNTPEGKLLAELRLPASSENISAGKYIKFGPIKPGKIINTGTARSFKIVNKDGLNVIVGGPASTMKLNKYDFIKGGLIYINQVFILQP